MENSDFAIFLTFGIIVFAVIFGLSFVVYNQNQEIEKLKTPKYGFLGKPLAIAIVVGLGAFAATGTLYFTHPDEPDTTISVSDDQQIFLTIEQETINSAARRYRFNLIPLINGIDWRDETFDVKWTIENRNNIIKNEYGLNVNFVGGINVTLDPGVNVITAEVIFNGEVYSTSITLSL